MFLNCDNVKINIDIFSKMIPEFQSFRDEPGSLFSLFKPRSRFPFSRSLFSFSRTDLPFSRTDLPFSRTDFSSSDLPSSFCQKIELKIWKNLCLQIFHYFGRFRNNFERPNFGPSIPSYLLHTIVQYNLYINLACLSVCWFVCLSVCINVKTAEPIGPNSLWDI